MARKIEVELVGDSRSLERAFGRSQAAGGKLSKTIGTGLKVAGAVGAAGLAAVGVAAKIGFDEFQEGQRVAAQTNAVLKSTGGVANVTAKEIDDLSVSLMKKSGVDDEVIKSGQNVLLTFTNIRNEAGKGNDIFTQATKTILDMSVALGTDLQSSTIQVGKALNDPIKGLTALTRVGVSFTEQQKEQITALVENGKKMEAQKLILKELRKEFGGSARAAGETFAGKIDILRERFNNWAGDMVGKVMPKLTEVFDEIGDFFTRFGQAKGFTAKLKVTWLGVSGVASDLMEEIRTALVGERKPLKLPGGQILEWTETQGLLDKLKEAIEEADWTAIGQTIGENISSKVKITAEFLGNAIEAMNAFVDSHLDELANIGAKILVAVFVKLTDPSFWAKNWELALGVAVAIFPFGKIVGLGRLIGGFLGKGIITSFMRLMTRLPIIVQEAVRFVQIVFGRLTGWLGEQLGRIPGWIRAAFRLSFVIAFVNGVQSLFERLRNAVTRVVEFIKTQFGKVPGFLQPVVLAFSGIIGVVLSVVEAVKTLIDWIGRIPSPGDVVGGISGAIGGAINRVTGGDALGGVVQRGGVRRVHTGERIVPARVARGGHGDGGGSGQFALIWAGPDFFRWMEENQTKRRRAGFAT